MGCQCLTSATSSVRLDAIGAIGAEVGLMLLLYGGNGLLAGQSWQGCSGWTWRTAFSPLTRLSKSIDVRGVPCCPTLRRRLRINVGSPWTRRRFQSCSSTGRAEAARPWMFNVGNEPPNPDRIGYWRRVAREQAGIDAKWRLQGFARALFRFRRSDDTQHAIVDESRVSRRL